MTKKSRQKLKKLIIFKGLSVAKICVGPESAPLNDYCVEEQRRIQNSVKHLR